MQNHQDAVCILLGPHDAHMIQSQLTKDVFHKAKIET